MHNYGPSKGNATFKVPQNTFTEDMFTAGGLLLFTCACKTILGLWFHA